MDQVKAMRAFQRIAQAKSLSSAAQSLGTTHSSLSRQLQALEASLGAQLVRRDTRGITLTEAGHRYLAACTDILSRLDAAHADAAADSKAPSGTLKVSMPLSIATLELPDWLPAFQARHAGIRLEVVCTDRFTKLVAEGIDVALRISAELEDASMMARTLAVSDMVLVAAPRYLAEHGLPRTPEDLSQHQCLQHNGPESPAHWTLHLRDGQQQTLKPDARFACDTITALYSAAKCGLGIAALTWHTVRADLQAGALVRVLPEVTLGQRTYAALYPRTRHVQPAVRAFIDFMATHYR
ncbi:MULTISPECIES: LysR family transcriptional regulator [Variovorax]|jgi:DNA-binding transcriptional LysR family regulator|uniref:LysR family transcriptional regulator n=1 Tax=Variovorax TaxID=34072 RepID=UPI0008CE7D1F|nr:MULTISPECIES: LysR family transcriptional regulator [Variovorax]MDQ0085129.1 DNA-binding transcriptional LysR family regulator [Variovorax boronicumulans]SET35273.1 transcriptional regulator, LysR family [Variovorax sp. OV084]